ncbi:xylose isomerase-like protein [Diaporthe sp. PMI_573]|nr:xylose isomerase-like protein [Diaporthaceae sp. PMI_573]
MVDISSFRWGFATASLSMQAKHTLEDKFHALQHAGFEYAELGMGGFIEWVRQQNSNLPPSTAPAEWADAGEPDPSDTELWEALYAYAPKVIELAQGYGISILMLQPLNQFEGWAKGTRREQWSRAKAQKWLPLCAKLGVGQIQVGSNDHLPADFEDFKVAEDLRWLAELGAAQKPPVKIAYESWSFGTRIVSWEHTWKLVQEGNHPNLGLCLDTAHFPFGPGYGWDVLAPKMWSEDDFQAMLGRLRAVPAHKIFYVELADVVPVTTALGKGSRFDEWRIKANSPRGDTFVWAACGRCLPEVGSDAGRGSENGAARVAEALKAILDTGFKGPLMFEPFEALSMETGDDVPVAYANAGSQSRKLLIEAVKKL